MKLDTVIAGVIALRDQIDAIKTRHKEELAPENQKLEKLENYLQSQLQTQGITSFAAKGVGTAFLQNVVSCKVEDWDATLGWIRGQETWEFLERRVAKSVVQEYIESQGSPPPGVAITTDIEVRVRRG